VFGGRGEGLLNDLWILTFSNVNGRMSPSRWQYIASSDGPSPRYNHASFIGNNKLFIFGGHAKDQSIFNDMYSIDIGSLYFIFIF
jgi:N-acetylneuraminic acid mutarotase